VPARWAKVLLAATTRNRKKIFADGHVLTGRSFSTSPEQMSLQSTTAGLNAWKLGTIWKP
jgi:hypothetical protein